MDLISVNSIDNEKGSRKTAELLKAFITENGFLNYGHKSSVTADYALAGNMGQHLKDVGLDYLGDFVSICNSHSHQNVFKRLLKHIKNIIAIDKCEGNSY